MQFKQIASVHVASCITLVKGTGIEMEVGKLVSDATRRAKHDCAVSVALTDGQQASMHLLALNLC